MHVSKSLPVPHYTDIVKKLVFNFYVDDSIVKIDFKSIRRLLKQYL